MAALPVTVDQVDTGWSGAFGRDARSSGDQSFVLVNGDNGNDRKSAALDNDVRFVFVNAPGHDADLTL
jgi:hypothetical protein